MGELVDMRQTTNPEHGPAREEVAATYRRLRRDYIEGRIALADFEAEVERVYASAGVPEQAVQPAASATRSTAHPRHSWREQVAPYAMVMAMLVGIWAVTGMGYFWPIWPMMGWGIPVMLGVMGMRSGCGANGANTRQHEPSLGGHRRTNITS